MSAPKADVLLYFHTIETCQVETSGLFLAVLLRSEEEWKKIVNVFASSSPSAATPACLAVAAVAIGLSLF